MAASPVSVPFSVKPHYSPEPGEVSPGDWPSMPGPEYTDRPLSGPRKAPDLTANVGPKARRTMPTPEPLETFANPHPGRDYLIAHETEEFTSLCPVTGQPDFGRIIIEYVADKLCVELKSLKIYLQSYRNEGIYYEDLTNRIMEHLRDLLHPRWIRLSSEWTPRGGIHSTITVESGTRPTICQ